MKFLFFPKGGIGIVLTPWVPTASSAPFFVIFISKIVTLLNTGTSCSLKSKHDNNNLLCT